MGSKPCEQLAAMDDFPEWLVGSGVELSELIRVLQRPVGQKYRSPKTVWLFKLEQFCGTLQQYTLSAY